MAAQLKAVSGDRPAATGKLPPQALEAEQSLLGGLLLESRKWDEVADEVGRDDFYHQNHRLIFAAIAGLEGDSQPVDIVTVCEWLQNRGELEKVGGLAYVSTLANNTPGPANIVAYAKIIREQAIFRELLAAANDITTMVYDHSGKKAAQVLDSAQQRVVEISEATARGERGFSTLDELVDQSVDRIEELSQSDDPVTGIPTGFADIDDLTAGLQRGELVVVAGRPSMGKTAFALNIAEYIAIAKELPVAVFSMEMPGAQLAQRMLASISSTDFQKLRKGQLDARDWENVIRESGKLKRAPMFVDDSAGLNAKDVRARTRRLWRGNNKKLGLVVVDYIQLMQSEDNFETRATEIAGITRDLKLLAMELEVPVMALSQLNRGVESRPNKRPMMADLRESGAIEQDADVIFFLYRDEVYNAESEDAGKAEVIVGKQRNGPIGVKKLAFLGQFIRFENLAPEYAGEYAGEYGG